MAHGIAGPLALLSIAQLAGWEVPGQAAAITAAAGWLLRWHDPSSGSWPTHITGTELDTAAPVPARGRRDAWCYGTPGISSALNLAGRALADEQLSTTADAALVALGRRPPASWDTTGAALCHGYGGVLQCMNRSAAHPVAATAIAALQSATGSGTRSSSTPLRTEPGFLTGAAGIGLALADLASLPASSVPAPWDSLLLLA